MSKTNKDFWNGPLTGSRIKSEDVKLPEMLIGYFIGPFGALLASGIFTSILQNYFTDVLKLNLTFLTTLQLFSTILIVAANLIVAYENNGWKGKTVDPAVCSDSVHCLCTDVCSSF